MYFRSFHPLKKKRINTSKINNFFSNSIKYFESSHEELQDMEL